MGLPRKLKNMNLFVDGRSHLGEVAEVTPPKLMIKIEEWRGGGMIGAIGIDMGLDKLDMDFTLGGLTDSALRGFGAVTHDAAQLRFAGAFQDDSSGQVQAAEITVHGRLQEADMGNAKPGDATAHKYKLACSYYRLDVDGENWIEIDMLGGIFIVFGIDRYAEIRAAIGA